MSNEIQKQRTYSISQTELKHTPEEIGVFKFGDQVTRANFASFLATGILVSCGVNSALGYYFEKVEFDTGLNITASAREVEMSGGLEVLSERERAIIFDAYRQANDVQKEELSDTKILSELNRLFTPGSYKDRSRRLPENAKSFQRQDFLDWLRNTSLEIKADYAELNGR